MKITTTDAHLARIFYSILIDHACNHPRLPIRYKRVLELARVAHPGDEVVQSAIPISMGRRLDVIVRFIQQHQLPPLTCLAVNESGHPGGSYRTVHGSWQADMDAVAAYDWAKWQGQWNIHIEATRKAAVPLKRRKEKEARELVHQSYLAGKVPRLEYAMKEQLVALIRDGFSIEDALPELEFVFG